MNIIRKIDKTKKRAREVVFMVLAVALLVVGVPLTLHLVKSWNDILPNGAWEGFGEDDYRMETLTEGNGRVVLYDNVYTPQDTIIWDEENFNHTLVIQEGETKTITNLYMFLNLTLQDLINGTYTKLSYNIEVPLGEHYLALFFYKIVDGVFEQLIVEGVDDGNGLGFNGAYIDDYDEYRGEDRSWLNGTIELTMLDLLLSKIEVGGSVKVCFDLVSFDELRTADIVTFKIKGYVPPSTAVKSETALNMMAGGMGIFLGLVAVASTSLWNPSPGSKPGWVDKKIKNIGKRRRAKRRSRG